MRPSFGAWQAVATEKATQLWTACSKVKSLREALVREASGDEQTRQEAVHTIRTLIAGTGGESSRVDPNRVESQRADMQASKQ